MDPTALAKLANFTPAGAVAGLVAGKGDPLSAVAGIATGAVGASPIGAVTGLVTGANPLDTLKGGPLSALTDIAGAPGTGESTGDGTGNPVAKVPNNIKPYYLPAILFTQYYMRIFAPSELCNPKNSRILLNIIMLYAINYIYKYDVKKNDYEVLKEIRDYLNINKDFLLDKTLTLSKDYLDIVHDAVEDIKLAEERDFLKQQDNDKMDNDKKIADNDLTFNYVKLVVDNSSGLSGGLFTTITSAIANIWKIMMMWTKPFAGLVILVGFIAFIILVFFGEDDEPPENSGGVGTGSLLGPNNFSFFSKNMQGSGGSNNNTDIISVLQRLPQNIYSFFDKLSKAYSKFSNYVNSSSDFMNSLSDTTPIIDDRPKQDSDNSAGLYDNIYTFDYKYINDIKETSNIDTPGTTDTEEIKSMIDTYVYNIKRPKKGVNTKISEYYGISHDYNFVKAGAKNQEYIYAPKCGTNNNYVYDDCTVKIKDCGEAKKEDTSDYKNIII